jgi:Ca-activated chloride channel family protein
MSKQTLTNIIILIILLFCAQSALADGVLIPGPPTAPAFTVKYHRVNVTIDNQVAETKIDQVFRNEANQEIEGTYLFPLPVGAVVSDFSMYAGDKEVKGRMLKKDEARKIYEDIVRKRKDPGLLEYVDRNTFHARIYPIPARGEKRVKMDYSEMLKMDSDISRYVYTLDTERFSNKPLSEVVITVDVRSKAPIKNVYSPTHNIGLSRKSDYHIQASYEASNVKPDEDFILYYTVSDDDIGLSLLAYREPDENGFYVLMASPKVNLSKEELGEKNVFFVLDTSGSMQANNKIGQAKDALKFCLNSLNEKDRFNIIAFNTAIESYQSEMIQAESQNIRDAIKSVDKFESAGGTNINEALLSALKAFTSNSSPNIIVFLTDGLPTVGETDINKILENIKKANDKNTRIFVFGVGYDVNTHFLDKLALGNKAESEYVRPEENIEAKVASFFNKVTSPVLSDISLDYGEIMNYDQFPRELPDLFRGGQLIVFGRYKGSGDVEIKLSGNIKGKKHQFGYKVEFPKQDTEHDFIPRLWAARKIGYLLDEIQLHGRKDELVDEIVQLGKKYGIMTEFTSFLIDADVEMGEEEARRITAERLDAGNQVLKGSWAVSQRQNAAMLRNQAQSVSNMMFDGEGKQVQLKEVKYVAGKTFFYRNGMWIDSTYAKNQKVMQIQNFSDAYFQISNAAADLNQYLALGENVIVNYRGQAIQISNEGQKALSQREVDAIINR